MPPEGIADVPTLCRGPGCDCGRDADGSIATRFAWLAVACFQCKGGDVQAIKQRGADKRRDAEMREPQNMDVAAQESGASLTFFRRFYEIRTGFERPFWVANISELFERLSYYAAFASLPRYLHESLNFGVERASSLAGLFGGLVWFLAAFGGALADRMGFRRALSLAYLILATSYFLLGSIGSPWLAPVRNAIPLVALVTFILMLPALGIALVKPCRCRDHGPRFQGKRALHWLLDLLHGGEHRRGRGAFSRRMGAPASQRGESLRHGGIERLCHVLRRVAPVQGAPPLRTRRRPKASARLPGTF